MLREKDNPNKIVWSEERAKIKALPFKEKIQYIWMYFKIPIIVAFFVIGFGTFLIVRIATNIPDNWLTVTFANTTVEFNAESYFDYLQNQARGNAYYNAFVSLADAGEIDAITMSKDSLAALGQSGRLFDLNDEACASLKEKYADRFIYYTPVNDEEHTAPIPVGIDVSDSLLVTKYKVYSGDCALGVGAHSENIKEVEDFLRFILEGK